MKIELQSVMGGVSQTAAFFKRHIHAILFVWLIAAIGVWGFIFWQYGYRVVFQQAEVTTKPLVIKEKELKALLEKAITQEEFKKTIMDKPFSNPFVKFPEGQ